MSENELIDYFDLMHKKINELKLNDKPMNIFNCDESGISAEQGKKRVFFKKGFRSPKSIIGVNEKQHYTIQV